MESINQTGKNENIHLNQKEVLTLNEACQYSGLSKSKMYKHTSSGQIAFYKPEGKFIYFKRTELEEWLLRNRHSSKVELEIEANRHLSRKK